MKELKFRLIKDKKIVGFERHVKSKETGNVLIFQSEDNEKFVNLVAQHILHDSKDQYAFTLGGQEIYGGDVFKVKNPKRQFQKVEAIGIVEFFGLSWQVKFVCFNKWEGYYPHVPKWDTALLWNVINNKEIELIGNIYDNPELVK